MQMSIKHKIYLLLNSIMQLKTKANGIINRKEASIKILEILIMVSLEKLQVFLIKFFCEVLGGLKNKPAPRKAIGDIGGEVLLMEMILKIKLKFRQE